MTYFTFAKEGSGISAHGASAGIGRQRAKEKRRGVIALEQIGVTPWLPSYLKTLFHIQASSLRLVQQIIVNLQGKPIMRSSPFLFVVGAAFATACAQSAAAQNQDLLARGTYLMNGPVACGNCHTQRGPDLLSMLTMYLAGGQRFTSPVFVTYARNITPDKDTGIGTWTDEQIIRAFREGVAKEGNTLGPPMPIEIYNKMSDDDAKAIVAYLRTVKPIHNEVQEPKYNIPLRPEPAAKGIAAPPKSDKVAYGGYIVNALAHCLECHTPQVGPARDYANQTGAGGFRFEFAGTFVFSPNITPDKETGIGAWTDDEIKRAITQGIDKDGKQLIPLMPYPYFKNMTAEDVDAVVAYLHTIPPVKKKNEPNPTLQSLVKK